MYRGMAALAALMTLFLAPGTQGGAAEPVATAGAPKDAGAVRFVFGHTISGSGPALPPASAPATPLERVPPDAARELAAGVPPAGEPSPASSQRPTAAPAQSNQEPAAVAPPAAVGSLPACSGAPMSNWAAALFESLNRERTARGLAALAVDACAARVAALRADDLATRGYFAHTSPDGASAASLLAELGLDDVPSGENLARNNYPDEENVAVAVRDLMASDAHRAVILNGSYTGVGVASADDGSGMRYYVMVFLAE